MTDRDPLFDDLAAAWSRWDPMPDDLPDRILTAVAMADLDTAYELLTLVARSDSLLGSRAGVDGRTIIEFTADGVHIGVRVADGEQGRRIDGWVEAARIASVEVFIDGMPQGGRVTSASRFELDGLPSGLAALEIELTDTGGAPRRFRSPHFEI